MALSTCTALDPRGGESEPRGGKCSPPPPPERNPAYLLLSALLRHMRSRKAMCPNFLDTSDQNFASFHNVLDNVFQNLCARGVGLKLAKHKPFLRRMKMRSGTMEVLGHIHPNVC